MAAQRFRKNLALLFCRGLRNVGFFDSGSKVMDFCSPMAPAKVSATSRLFTSTVMRRCCFDVRGGVFGGGT